MKQAKKRSTEKNRTRRTLKNNSPRSRPAKQTKAKKLQKNEIRREQVRQTKPLVKGSRRTRKHLEQEVRQQTGELKIKNGQLKRLGKKRQVAESQINIHTQAIESAADGIFILNAKKRQFPLIYANPAFLKMTGYGKEEIVGKGYLLFYGAGTDVRVVERIKKALIQNELFYGEVLSYRKNGDKLWGFLRLAPVRLLNGPVTHFVGVQTDVTQLKREELLSKVQREELLHISRVGKLGELVSSLAHEINQPLTAILSYAQAAQRMLVDGDPKLREIMQYIIEDNQRAAAVIRRLRTLLKKQKPQLAPLNINELVAETIELITTDIILRNKVLKTDLDANLPLIQGDRVHLQQVLLNLISNSLEAMERINDAEELLIRTSRQDPGMILVEVKDSGNGIAAQDVSSLFTHYFTTKPKGLGMGLAISRSIIEEHGGNLEFKNNIDRGATFYFTLPVEKKDGP